MAIKNKTNVTIILSGVFGLILALFGILPLLIIGVDKLTMQDSSFFIGRHFLSISLLTGSTYCFLLGMLTFTGKIVPFIIAERKADKIKLNLLGTTFSFPIILSATVLIFDLSKNNMWKVFWIIFIALYFFIASIQIKEWVKFKNGQA